MSRMRMSVRFAVQKMNMAAPSTNCFDRLTAHLEAKIHEYEMLTKQCRQICSDCRSLLKPWENEMCTGFINGQTTKKKDLDKKTNEISKDIIENERNHENNGMNEEEMKLVEQLLVKAQKAREIQTKMEAKSSERKKVSETAVKKTQISYSKSDHQSSNPVKKLADEKENQTKSIKAKPKPVKSIKPVHETAPYKTESTSYRKHIPSNKKRPTSTAASKSVSTSSSSGKSKRVDNSESDIKSNDNDRKFHENKIADEKSSIASSIHSKKDVSPDFANRGSESKETKKCQRVSTNESDGGNNMCDEKQQFLLVRDGHQLKVPSKLKSALAKNYKLQKEMMKALNQNTAEHTQPEFFTTYENNLTLNKTAMMHQFIAKLTKKYCLYQSLIKEFSSSTLSASSLPELLRMKLVLEKALIFIANSEKQYRTLKKESLKFVSSINESEEISSRVEKYFDDHRGQKCLAPTPPADSMVYSKPHQLYKYSCIQSKLDMLNSQSELLSYSGDLLKVLKSLDVNDCDAACVYRSVHSLLCERGRQFPTLIADYGCDDENSMFDEHSDM